MIIPKNHMPAKKKATTTKHLRVKTKSKELSNIINNIKETSEDKMLKKIEDYVDKNWNETAQKIAEKKSKRPTNHYKKAELEAMISRISIENDSSSVKKDSNKWLIYLIYIIVIITILLIFSKFYAWNIPQIQ